VIDDAADAGLLSGALLATQLGQDTGHIAQVVVDGHARGGGLARGMLAQSLDAMRRRGLSRVSLLVARTNGPARRLYDAIGFRPTGTFITGIK
jgi:ribosomal protein S18 acetylase RimI-like enzyme